MIWKLLENRRALGVLLAALIYLSWQIQEFVILPIEQSLGLSIAKFASIFYIPAGFVFLAFYLLRWWYFPVVLVSKGLVDLQFRGDDWTPAGLIPILLAAIAYPLWLRILNNARWDVFGTMTETALL